MAQNLLINSIPQQFHDWFIKPILEIPLDNPNKNEIFRNLMNKRLSVDLNKSLELIKQNLDYLLTLKSKKQLLEYLYNVCPPKDHHYITWFKRLLGMTCNQIILMYQDEDLAKLNDVVIEFWVGHFELYSIKIYQNRGSLQRLREETNYILEELTGFESIRSFIEGGLGAENHVVFNNEAEFNGEVWMSISFIQLRKKILSRNNIYILFWSRNNKIQLWKDLSLKTIEMICDFLNKFLSLPNIEVVNVNVSDYKVKKNLPEQIIETIDMIGRIKTPLKFDRIIERSIKFNEDVYNAIIREINTSYLHYCFTGMYILIRKLLENLVLDSLRLFYSTSGVDKYYNSHENKFLGFNRLRKNFQAMINESDFIQKVHTIDQKIIDWLLLFKESGDIHAHSLFSIGHQNLIEENIGILNELLKILDQIKIKIKE
ncbi:hypothetical protein LCGC14_1072330 [marine sediment metagenome]|uniref:Uncharacterized protein n=1 Tax=marine sediment metagenome TaxID=412755 RepID=A0A0F9N547_9ZZZZ